MSQKGWLIAFIILFIILIGGRGGRERPNWPFSSTIRLIYHVSWRWTLFYTISLALVAKYVIILLFLILLGGEEEGGGGGGGGEGGGELKWVSLDNKSLGYHSPH